ncbi:integrase catalytic domain-containing protein [Mobiluncus curtisii]|uniref:integrase catalytic domain-containing protein n=1 Tax=Mobiluncus curtisii TaxID=2051 RepID=UPI001470592C|nr:DDE-type integrase/transposase/recombinase [Mobiluncus curtisii]
MHPGHVAFAVDRKLDAASTIELLDLACLERGERPRVTRMDNGPEFVAHALQEWATEDGSSGRLSRPVSPGITGSLSRSTTG